ncbi:MAG: NAD(P)H-dependent oxidoreductase [Acetatifactor sp.]|nr:NAD(P)H-dependent oxidoreductase [Acetatifactor sp.]
MEGADVYLDILVKAANIDAMKAIDMTLTLDYDGAGQAYRESTYTFDLNTVKLEKNKGDVKVLVVYFSATNTTKGVAKKLADAIDADLYQIVPAKPYTSADLDYNNSGSRANKEMNNPNARPEISGSVENMEQYDIVFIGYPIWWGQAPKIICTFMESYDFSGKTIVPFCTSGSSGIGSSATNLERLTNGAVWLPGKRFSGGVSQNTIVEWVNGLDLNL